MTSLVVGWLVVGCHARALWPNGASYAYSYSKKLNSPNNDKPRTAQRTLIGNPTPGIQWYNFRPPGISVGITKMLMGGPVFASEASEKKFFQPLLGARKSWLFGCDEHYPSIFNSFPVIRTASAKNRRFHVPQPTFLFPLETPLRLSPNMFHGWKDNSMLAKRLAASTYLSSIVSELYNA